MATGSIYLKFERVDLKVEAFAKANEANVNQLADELEEMRKLLGELNKKLSSSSSSQGAAAQFIPMKKIKQALAKLTDNAAVLIQGEPPSKLLCYYSSSAGCTFVVRCVVLLGDSVGSKWCWLIVFGGVGSHRSRGKGQLDGDEGVSEEFGRRVGVVGVVGFECCREEGRAGKADALCVGLG